MKTLSKKNNVMSNTLEAFSFRSCWCYCNACNCGCDCNKTRPTAKEQSTGKEKGRSMGGDSVRGQSA